MKFPSPEWAAAYQAAINSNEAYSETARGWQGEIFLVVDADSDAPLGEGILLDLHHGSCRAATFLGDAVTARSEFVYRGPRAAWRRLFRRDLDPVRSVLDVTFRLQGNLAKALRFTRATKALVETAVAIPTEICATRSRRERRRRYGRGGRGGFYLRGRSHRGGRRRRGRCGHDLRGRGLRGRRQQPLP